MSSLDTILTDAGIEIITNEESYDELSERVALLPSEIRYIDLNRTGIFLPAHEVRTGFRARLLTDIATYEPRTTYFALPVRGAQDTNFTASGAELRFNSTLFGRIHKIELDSCDTSYMRRPDKLNLNSRRRGNCEGCEACVHHYKDLYDHTVLKDTESLESRQQIAGFFDKLEQKGVDIGGLSQIAVVTGLFHGEDRAVEHMRLVKEVASAKGFCRELLYFGCEVNSREALRQLSELGNFALVYAVDNFTKRKNILNPAKTKLSLDQIRETLSFAKDLGIQATYSYIVGIDDLGTMLAESEKLIASVNRFPVINIYQVQTQGQINIIEEDAKKLGYYLEARLIFEELFRDSCLTPRRWENYRPLWYDFFKGKPLEN